MNHNHYRNLELERSVGPLLDDLANKGGGTYQALGGLAPFRPFEGYAVGIGGVALSGAVDGESLSWAIGKVISEFRPMYVGTWLSGGTVYIDAVMYFAKDRRPEALNTAYQAGQEAIFDFETGEAIDVGEPVDFQR